MAKKATDPFHTEPIKTQIKATILEATGGKIQTKRFHPGGCETYSFAKFFKHEEIVIDGFDGLFTLLRELETQPQKMLVMGSVIDEFRSAPEIVRRSNSKEDEPATLEDTGSYLLHFDVDDLLRPDHLSWDDPEALAKWTWKQICNRLPVLKSVSAFWQASSSAGTEDKQDLAKFHFWILADRPLLAYERKHLFKTVGSDDSLASPAQPNYTAFPIFDGVPDPLTGSRRSGVLRADKDFLDTSGIGFPSHSKARKAKPRDGISKNAKTSDANPYQGKCSTTLKGLEILKAACAGISIRGPGNTSIFNQSQTVGGYVAGGEIALDDARNQLLAAAAATGYERFAEAVENGLKTGLERPLSLASDKTTLEPYYPAPTIPRDVAINLHTRTIKDWARRAKAFHSKARTRACGHSGFPLGLISDSNFQNGGLNERATVCGVGHLVAAA